MRERARSRDRNSPLAVLFGLGREAGRGRIGSERRGVAARIATSEGPPRSETLGSSAAARPRFPYGYAPDSPNRPAQVRARTNHDMNIWAVARRLRRVGSFDGVENL
jgi:hypothetical protein